MDAPTPSRREAWPLIGIFCAALIAHVYFATFNWKSAFLPGHEFRQTQTALVTYYIDQQDNFSLRYETPVFGKPWVALPLEVPIYEWGVVWLSRATGLPHFKSARSITLTCFYLALPALYLVLGRMGLPRPRRLLILALVLACPVYIYYSRAFLIDSMELMCCAWFLYCYLRMMDERRWSWLAATTLVGTGAALIKNTTYLLWLLPAAAFVVVQLWRDARARSWRALAGTVAWGLGGVVVSLVLLYWWIAFTDAIKAAHPAGAIFTSKSLAVGNYGLLDLGARFAPSTWSILFERWSESIAAPWIVGLVVVAGLVLRSTFRWWIVALAGLFILAQALFPFAYAYQDYYYYACAVFLMGAFGYALFAVLDSGLPTGARWLLVLLPFAALISTYWHGYRTQQILVSRGGTGLTNALLDITPKGSVFVIIGADWAPIVPYYTQHKALMVRSGLETDAAYLDRAFADLDDEDVAAVILMGNQRGNQDLVRRAMAKFHIGAIPTFSHPTADVYYSRFYNNFVVRFLQNSNPYEGVVLHQEAAADPAVGEPLAITPGMAHSAFKTIQPGPYQFRVAYGFSWVRTAQGEEALTFHPDCDLWMHAPAKAASIQWDYGIHDSAWKRSGGQCQGVIYSVAGEVPGGPRRELYRRVMDPANVPADRGDQHEVFPYQPRTGETLIFSTRPLRGYAFDWAYTLRILVK